MDEEFDLLRTLKGKRKGGLLEDWFVYKFVNYLDKKRMIVMGHISGDQRFDVDVVLKTSQVVAIHEKERILETKYTYYELGEPASEETKMALKVRMGFLNE